MLHRSRSMWKARGLCVSRRVLGLGGLYASAILFVAIFTLRVTEAETLAQGAASRKNTANPVLYTGRRFQQQLRKSVVGWSWKGRELRQVFRGISDDQHIAILLDRRVNPNRAFRGDFGNLSVQDALQQMADRVGAEARFVGSTVYVGPRQTCARMRTAVHLLNQQLDQMTDQARRLQLRSRRTVRWDDLQEPRRIIEDIAARFRLQVEQLDRVPYDLWSAGVLPQATANEALCLVLAQFDLWFRWNKDAGGIEIVSLPPALLIERRYPSVRTPVAETAKRWKRDFPGLTVKIQKQALVVQGTLEQHEMIAAGDATSRAVKPGRNPKPADVLPIKKRNFTLTIKDVPASALIKKLEMSGMEFDFDARQLKSAGVDLDQRIQMQVRMADAETFFHALFDQMQIDFEILGLTVRLKPR